MVDIGKPSVHHGNIQLFTRSLEPLEQLCTSMSSIELSHEPRWHPKLKKTNAHSQSWHVTSRHVTSCHVMMRGGPWLARQAMLGHGHGCHGHAWPWPWPAMAALARQGIGSLPAMASKATVKAQPLGKYEWPHPTYASVNCLSRVLTCPHESRICLLSLNLIIIAAECVSRRSHSRS